MDKTKTLAEPRIRIDDLPPLENLNEEEMALIFGAGRTKKAQLGVEALENRELMATAISASLSSGLLRIEGTDLADNIQVRQMGSALHVTGTNPKGSFSRTFDAANVAQIEILGLKGDDRIDLGLSGDNAVRLPSRIYGGDGNDTLRGGSGNDVLIGGSGNDWIDGGAGNDWLEGNDGNDTLFGGDGNDWLKGQAGADVLDGGAGNDVLYGNDFLDPNPHLDGGDFLTGGPGNDWLEGGAHADTIYGFNAGDTAAGWTDADKIITNGVTLTGKIASRWMQLGGETSKLGKALNRSDSFFTHGERWNVQYFEHAGIYSGSDRTVEVRGAAYNHWASLDRSTKESLGRMVDSSTFASGGEALNFRYGHVFASANGAFVLSQAAAPAIWQRYQKLSIQDKAAFGAMIGSDSFNTHGESWAVVYFKGGGIYSGPDRTIDVRGAAYNHWASLDRDSKKSLGRMVDSSTGIGWEALNFRHGSVYTSSAGGFIVSGKILSQLRAKPGLGAPTGKEFSTKDGGSGQHFQNGGIYVRANREVIVIGDAALWKRYLGMGAEKSSLGLPTSNGIDFGGGWWGHRFDKGVIYVRGAETQTALGTIRDQISHVSAAVQTVVDSLQPEAKEALRALFLEKMVTQPQGFSLNYFEQRRRAIEDTANEKIGITKDYLAEREHAARDYINARVQAVKNYAGEHLTWQHFAKQTESTFRNIAITIGHTVADLGIDAIQIIDGLATSLQNAKSGADVANALWVFVRDVRNFAPTHAVDIGIDLLSDELVGSMFGRRLTDGERAFAHSIFGNKIDVSTLRVTNLAIKDAGMVGGNLIYMDGEPLHNKPLFAHELTHVYQDQNFLIVPGTIQATREAFTVSRDVYAVNADHNLSWHQLRPEQQARVVQNYQKYFHDRSGFTDDFYGNSVQAKKTYLRRVIQQAGLFEWK